MGYRSDVAYTIRFTDEESYRLFILEAKAKDLGSCFSDDTSNYEEAECNDERLRIDFKAEGVKWYEGYADVDRHNKLIALAEDWAHSDTHRLIKEGADKEYEVSHRIGYVFIRLGEENDDIEENHGGNFEYHWLSVRREIIDG